MTLSAFLNARLDEDEATARAATPGPWVAGTGNDHDALVEQSGGGHLVARFPECISDHGDWSRADAGHIARHDPVRTLREVEVKRKLVSELAPQASELDRLVDKEYATQRRDLTKDPYLGEILLRTFAAVYSDHPDYRKEWSRES